jgi:hypothetical protein
MRGRHRVQNQIQALCGRGHSLLIAGDQKPVRAGGQGGRLLGRRCRDSHHGVAHCLGQPQAHLTQAADADHADGAAAVDSPPMFEGGVHCDAGAEDGTSGLQRIVGWDLKQEYHRKCSFVTSDAEPQLL